jgi:PmbA protein
VRAYRGTRLGLAYTNDLSDDAVRDAATRAAALAEVAAEDVASGLPDAEDVGAFEGDLDTVDASAHSWTADTWITRALRTEGAAREDERITMSEGARSGGGTSRMALASSSGFSGEREQSYCFAMMGVFATGAEGERQRDHYSTQATHLEDLERPEDVGREAARRAIRRCGFRKPKSGAFPVVFSPDVSRDLVGTIAQAVSGSMVHRRATFLADAFGETIGSENVTVVDDATLPRRMASRSFDGEGVRSRRTVLMDKGTISAWMADSYSARRLGIRPTGNASRSLSGRPGVGPSNLVLEPGARAPEALIGDVPDGLYLTELFGLGVNLASGAWSRGGGGIWIENGELTYPVQELTVAGDLRSILSGVSEVASDLTWHGRMATPTLRVDGLTIAAG